MNIYGELTRAQLENLSAAPTPALKGRAWWRTDVTGGAVEVDTGTVVKRFLLNDQNAVLGTNATANTNTRLNRSGVGKLQLVLGGDTTAEGTDSSNIAQLSYALEQYTSGTLPAASTARAGQVVLNTTLNTLQYCLNSAWNSVGAGGGGGAKNYLSTYNGNTGNGNFELGATTGFSLFNTTMTGVLPTGTITLTAASITTFNTVAAGQLAGNNSLQTAASGVWSAGQGFISSAFTIDIEDQAKMMTVSGYYKVVANAANGNFSGTSSNTFAVYIYDVTNAAWIQPAGVYGLTQNSGVGRFSATFQTTSNSTQYQLAIVAVNASAGAINLYWDDLTCGPQTAPIGAPMTDWIAYTPNFTNSGSVSNVSAYYKRVGDSVHVRATWQNGTVSGTNSFTISLPSGLSIDTSKVSADNTALGFGWQGGAAQSAIFGAGAALVPVYDAAAGTGVVAMPYHTNSASTTPAYQYGANGANNNCNCSVEFIVAVAGWSSNLQVSNDTDTRVVATYTTGTTTVFTTGGLSYPITPTTIVKDTHAGWSGSNYKVPVSGFYQVGGSTRVSTACTYASLILTINGGSTFTIAQQVGPSTAGMTPSGLSTVYCNAGDLIAISGNFSASGATLAECYLFINRMSGPAVVASTEAVYASYQCGTAQSLAVNNTIVPFDTKMRDTHGAFTTGAASRFTAPVSGMYRVSCFLSVNSFQATSVGQYIGFNLYKNGSIFTGLAFSYMQVTSVISTVLTGSNDVYLLAGDYIDLRSSTNTGTSAGSLSGTASNNFISIARLGN